jgi:Uma2 family endonuclease
MQRAYGKMYIYDDAVSEELIRRRRKLGLDRYDEVWDGVYVMPPMPNTDHQDLSTDLAAILREIIKLPGLGRVHAGANVSDRRRGWEKNYRCPDVIVVLRNGRAVDCKTHWLGGPDFLIEIQSPGDETDQKIPFYSAIGVRGLHVIQRVSRELTLYRHDGTSLAEVAPENLNGRRVLRSTIVPLAFRRRTIRGVGPRVEVVRTDGPQQTWLV